MTTRPTPRPAGLRPTDPPTLRLRDPAGVVAAVPYLLGFLPRRSLVVVGVDDGQGVGATLRADLPTDEVLGAGDGSLLPAAWAHVGRVMHRNGCSRALVVVYADVDPADLTDEAVGRLLDTLGVPVAGTDVGPRTPDLPDVPDGPDGPDVLDVLDVLDGPDVMDVLDVLLVGPRRFRSLLCPDRACCPVEGVAVTTSGSHPVAASFVLAGRSAAAGREDVEPPVPPADSADRAAAERAAGVEAGVRRTRPSGPAAAARDRRLLREWLACLPVGPSPELAGRLAGRWRSDPRLRDACLTAFLPGGPALARRLLGVGEQPPATSFATSLVDPACARAAVVGAPVLRRMAALVPTVLQAEVLAAHAWLAWVSGEGTAAALLAERSLVLDPGHRLARLVLQCLDHGLGAPWTTVPASARVREASAPPRGITETSRRSS